MTELASAIDTAKMREIFDKTPSLIQQFPGRTHVFDVFFRIAKAMTSNAKSALWMVRHVSGSKSHVFID
jgi:hypothetical protein